MIYIEECGRTFESLLYVDGFLGAGLKVRNTPFRLAKGHGPL